MKISQTSICNMTLKEPSSDHLLSLHLRVYRSVSSVTICVRLCTINYFIHAVFIPLHLTPWIPGLCLEEKSIYLNLVTFFGNYFVHVSADDHLFTTSREEHLEGFTSWLKENGVSMDKVKVVDYGVEGYGLQATEDIKVMIVMIKIQC